MMNIKDMPHVTVEQVLALRKAAIELEQELAELKASLPKIKADAVRGLVSAIEGAIENDYISMKEVEEMELEDFCNLAVKHADKLEAGE
jgi:cell division protein ZapA (FtsZ GTPase activity inhibitor)